jgi:histidinol-phosphate aminotransferase
MKLAVPDYILSIAPYKPGKPLEELQRETGIGQPVKLASNENPFGPSPLAVSAIRQALATLHRYPDGAVHDLVLALSRRLQVPAEAIVCGNGSDDIIGMLTRAFLCPGDEAILAQPSFLMYEIQVRCAGATPVCVPLCDFSLDLDAMLDRIGPKTRMVFICNPNNPTGTTVTHNALKAFLDAISPEVVVVVDEAYMEFVQDAHCARSLAFFHPERPLVTLRTFSKAYGLAGLRVGYGVMPPAIADVLHRVRQPFTVSLPAQAGALAALEDSAFLEKSIALVHGQLDVLYAALDDLGLAYVPTQANFFLIEVGHADAVFEALLQKGVIVRSMRAYGLSGHIRINVGLPEENRRFIEALGSVMGSREQEMMNDESGIVNRES